MKTAVRAEHKFIVHEVMADHYTSVGTRQDSTSRSMILDALIENSFDAIVITDPLEFIQRMNAKAEELFNTTRNQAAGRKITTLVPSETLLQLRATHRQSNQSSSVVITASTGERIQVTGLRSEVIDNDNSVIANLYIFRDVRSTAQDTEVLDEKVQALESFAYSISHDLRAPLRRIVNYAEILQEDHFSTMGDEAQRIVTRMAKNTQKMSELIDDLVSYSRFAQQPMHKAPLDMNVVVSGIVNELKQSEDGARVKFIIEYLPPVAADRALIKTAFTCLIDNAIKFSKPKENPIVRIIAVDKSDHILYSVIDSGVGFDMQYSHKLFNVFQRLHNPNSFEGNGIGLAVVSQIVGRHHGKVQAEGKVDEGATFSISLPKQQP